MKRFSATLSLAVAVLCLTACGGGDPYEAAAEDVMSIMTELEETLGQVEDLESVEKLGPKFESLGEELNAVAKDMAALEEPSEEKAKAIEEKYKPQMEELQDKLQAQMTRIKGLGPDVMGAVMTEMEKMEPTEEMPDWMD
jgi:predicted  nucleic acid-binding Zn-ribbon protein